ncbi:MAG: acetyl-CoA C-acyltransferase [Nitrospinota bacterium]
MEGVVVLSALRTPVGKLLGDLSSFTAPELCKEVIKKLLEQSKLHRSKIDEVIMGNVISSGIGQNPARQAALFSGLSSSTPAFTVNKVCGSGLKAITLGAQAIRAGDADVVLSGGMESMSNAPFLLKDFRRGKKIGEGKVLDSMVNDGLWDIYNNGHMGDLCEFTAQKYKISREEQDRFAAESHKKAAKAASRKWFSDEIISLSGNRKLIGRDETIRRDTNATQLSLLRPAFKKNGTITAGNASSVNDGAAALLLMSEKLASKLGLSPIARVTGYAEGHLDPKWYTVAPAKAVKRVLKKANTTIQAVDLFELNEAFAAQALAVMKELDLDPAKVNVHGGAIALGHPIGASGARIVVTLLHALKRKNKKTGVAALCLGGGGSVSLALEVF